MYSLEKNSGVFCHLIDIADDGKRLDLYLAEKFKDISRSFIAGLIREGGILVDKKKVKPSFKLRAGLTVEGFLPEQDEALKAEKLALDIVYEDRDILLINKAAGMLVHPAPSYPDKTLANALLYHYPELSEVGLKDRPGIVHRLDKDTSGLLLVAKTQLAYERLSFIFHERLIKKLYLALVWGNPSFEGVVDAPIARHPVDKKRMSVDYLKGKEAFSSWKLKESYKDLSLLELDIKTGRTHQIRVHLSYLGYPIVGDELYGFKKGQKNLKDKALRLCLMNVKRQMLHAYYLGFKHPVSEEYISFKIDPAPDMSSLFKALSPWAFSSDLNS